MGLWLPFPPKRKKEKQGEKTKEKTTHSQKLISKINSSTIQELLQ